MTIKELENRIDRLRPRPIIVLCKLPNGKEAELTANEYLQDAEADFVMVTAGNDLRQVAAILDKLAGGDKCAIK